MQCLQQCSAVPTVLYLEERMITKEAVMNNLNTGRQQAEEMCGRRQEAESVL